VILSPKACEGADFSIWFIKIGPSPAPSILYASFAILSASAVCRGRTEKAMKSRLRTRTPRGWGRPDLVYAGVAALIICVGLIARGAGLLPQ